MKDNARTIKYDSITSYAKEYGVENLSNENLIASIIGIDPMLQGNEPIRKIFDGSHSLRKASKRTLRELTAIKGIGEKKATAILAAFELGKRLMKEKSQELIDLGSSLDVYNYILPYVKDLEIEESYLFCMDSNFKLIKNGSIIQRWNFRNGCRCKSDMQRSYLMQCYYHSIGSQSP